MSVKVHALLSADSFASNQNELLVHALPFQYSTGDVLSRRSLTLTRLTPESLSDAKIEILCCAVLTIAPSAGEVTCANGISVSEEATEKSELGISAVRAALPA